MFSPLNDSSLYTLPTNAAPSSAGVDSSGALVMQGMEGGLVVGEASSERLWVDGGVKTAAKTINSPLAKQKTGVPTLR
jgi:hypothetical protein